MNVLDIFKNSILEDPDSVYIEEFPSGDRRCIFTELTSVYTKEAKFKGKAFWYNAGTETFETFWNDQYYCSSKHFSEFMVWVMNAIKRNNFCRARFKNLSEEAQFFSEIDK